MAYIPTGRSRTITCTGTISFTAPTTHNLSVTPSGFLTMTCEILQFAPGLLGPGVYALDVGLTFFSGDPSTGLNPTQTYVQLSVGGFGYSAAATLGPLVSTTTTGTWTMSVDCVALADLGQTFTANAPGIFVDRPKQGGTVSASITFGGVTASFSNTISALYAYPLDAQANGYSCKYQWFPVSVTTWPYNSGDTVAFSMSPTFMSQALVLPYTHNYGAYTVDLTAGNSYSGPGTGWPIITCSRDPTRQITLTGQINAFNGLYPSPITTEWRPINNPTGWTFFSFGDTVSLDNYAASVGGLIVLQKIDGNGVTARMSPTSLAVNGENTTNTTLGARMTPFDAITLWQDASYVVDPCTATTGWSSNVSLVGGFLQVNSASLSGVASKNFTVNPFTSSSHALDSSGYRYLELDIQPNSTSNGTLNVSIIGATTNYPWLYTATMGIAGVLTTIRIRLDGPYASIFGSSPLYNSHVSDSLYTSVYPGTNEGPGWGLDGIRNFALTFPGSSGTYQIHAIRLVRDTIPRLTLLDSSLTFPLNSGLTAYDTKYAYADTDGKRSMMIGSQSPYGGFRPLGASLGSFTNAVSQLNGWHVNITVSGADSSAWYFTWWLNQLGGQGAIYTGTNPTDFWIDKPLTSNPTTIPYQAVSNAVVVHPYCGDEVKAGAYGSPFIYYMLKFLRGRSTGVALDKTLAPISAQTVTQTDTTTSVGSGSGTTNTVGRFLTGSTFAETAHNQKCVLDGVTPATGTLTVLEYTADILRLAYLAQPQVGSAATPYHVQHNLGQIHVSTVINGNVVYERSDQTTPIAGWATSNVVTSYGDVQYAKMAIDPETNRIHLLVTRKTGGAYNVYVLYSDSDGADFTSGTLLVANALGASVWVQSNSAMGYTWFVYNSGTSGPGTQQAQFTEGSGQAFGATYTFKDSVGNPIQVADGGWANVQESQDYANRLTWCPVLFGSTSPTVLTSSDNGVSWS